MASKEIEYGYIYILTCLVTMKEYVGQAKCWKTRWCSHCRSAVTNSPYVIHAAIRTYGAENFAITIVRRCPLEELNYWEEYYIDKFDTLMPYGYNMTVGGDGVRGRQVTKKTRTLVAQLMRNYHAEHPEVRVAMSHRNKGKKRSAKVRAILSKAQNLRYAEKRAKNEPMFSATALASISEKNTGRVRSEETRARQSAAAKCRWAKKSERTKQAIRIQAIYTANPELVTQNSLRVKQYYATHPEAGLRQSERAKIQMANPAMRALIAETAKEVWLRKGYRDRQADQRRNFAQTPEGQAAYKQGWAKRKAKAAL